MQFYKRIFPEISISVFSGVQDVPQIHKNDFHQNFFPSITDRISGNLYGAISLSNNQKFNNGEIAFWIGEKYWGKGYGTEAAKALIEFAFQEKKLHKVFARYFKSNPASGRIMQKVGRA
ncbi:GNAT family N-acetyltransferase [Lederbergia galactosidilytica]|uniref:GNAT family N-acetyltransferase n=1 Tax=Lederbergia galactosidilytica TaxID=217031 RepID=UPI0007DB4B1E